MKKESRSFGIGMTAWVIGIVAIIVFIVLLAFAPKTLLSPLDGGRGALTSSEDQVVSGTMRFIGVLPCQDCDGIRTVLELRPDGTFSLEETFLGDIATRPSFQIGNWTTLRGIARDLKAVIYQLNHDRLTGRRNFLLLSDGNVKMLDDRQNEFETSMNYTLERQ